MVKERCITSQETFTLDLGSSTKEMVKAQKFWKTETSSVELIKTTWEMEKECLLKWIQ